MQQSNAPAKLVLPFANAGAKNTIPAASQIGIVAGAASLTDGFPPLTRTPLVAGGTPPSGLDMNGILFALAAINRWSNAGARYAYDSAFATDANVNGYPKGAVVLRSDGLGGWLNTAENNTTDPEAGGAGWVPDYQYGITAIAMTNANVTLTPLQAGRPIIVISGVLTANLNLNLPTYNKTWVIVNNTTGSFTITAKTVAGTGVLITQAASTVVYGDGTNIGIASNSGGGGAVGGGTDKVFYENDQVVTANYTLSAGKNAVTAGTITINDGVTVTVPNGATWSIV